MGSLAFLAALVGSAVVADAACPASPFEVTDAATAAQVENGFACPSVDLVIKFNLTITAQTITINAKTITIISATPADPLLRIQVINDNANSAIQMVSKGDITFTGATVMAHKNLKCTCTDPGCKFTSTLSDIVTAAAPFTFPPIYPLGGGGVITWDIDGPIDIRTTNVHGGDSIEMESKTSSITLLCGSEIQPCKDPNTAPVPKIILDQCPDPANPGQIKFPCTPTFTDAAELRSVCIGDVRTRPWRTA